MARTTYGSLVRSSIKVLLAIFLLSQLFHFSLLHSEEGGSSFSSAVYTLPLYRACKDGRCIICKSCPPTDFRVGLGGFYLAQTPEARDYIGYFRISMREASPKRRLQFFLDMLFGGGKHRGESPFFSNANSTSLYAELNPKLGLNLLSENLPLYLNLGYSLQGYNSNASTKQNKYSLLTHTASAELEGFLPLGERLRVEYAGGYDYIFAGSYRLAPSTLGIDASQGWHASLGYSHLVGSKVGYYLKLLARYQRVESSAPQIPTPITQYFLGIELGLLEFLSW